MKDNILVSVLCNTYNHEKYVRDALEGFVKQKTNFKFEVIVHDDASTDNTAEVIREFETKYPDLIFPIYQKENQYSQGINVSAVYQYPRARGKYIAYCEGDDFWISEHKLQKQIDYLETHPECSLCICNAKCIDIEGNVLKGVAPVEEDRICTTEEVILGGGGFCSTNSIVSKTELFLNRPDFFKILSIDLVIQMYLASCGTTFCFSEELAVYRRGVENSWSNRMARDKEKYLKHMEKVILVREAFDKYTDYKFHATIEEKNLESKFFYYRLMGDFKELKNKCYLPEYKKMSLKEKILFNFQKYLPGLYKNWNKLRCSKNGWKNNAH